MSKSLKLEWVDALNSGDRATDIQHKFLVHVINDLAESIEKSEGGIKVRKILLELKYYTLWHFEREEKFMYDNNCPMADINKAAHKVFIKTFLAFEEEYRNSKGEGTDELAERIYLELTKWLVNHILKVDGSIKDCVPSKQHLSLR